MGEETEIYHNVVCVRPKTEFFVLNSPQSEINLCFWLDLMYFSLLHKSNHDDVICGNAVIGACLIKGMFIIMI